MGNSLSFNNPEPVGAADADKQDTDLSDSAVNQQNTDCQQWGISAQRPRLSDSAKALRVTKTFPRVAGTYF